MKRGMDRLFFRLLGCGHRWILRRARTIYHRETMRRLERHVAWQKPELN